MPELVEHDVATMVLQRAVGIALGYEDLNVMTNCGTIRYWGPGWQAWRSARSAPRLRASQR